MLSNCQNLCNKISRKCTPINGLPQRSVLVSILFNLYISNLSNTISKKFIYADDTLRVACKEKQLKDCEIYIHIHWYANFNSFWTSSVSIVYSVPEYYAPIWLNSAHTKKIDDFQLNRCMRIITGTIKSTLLHWLPVITNITLPHLRRGNALLKEWKNATVTWGYLHTPSKILFKIHHDVNYAIHHRNPSLYLTTLTITQMRHGKLMTIFRTGWST